MNSRTKCFLLNLLSGFIVVLICAASFFALVNIVFNSVYIKTEVEGFSMLPTLNTTVPTSTEEGDVIYINKFCSYTNNDIVVAKRGDSYIIKRLVGMPGDKIQIKDEGLTYGLYVNDSLLYSKPKTDVSLDGKHTGTKKYYEEKYLAFLANPNYVQYVKEDLNGKYIQLGSDNYFLLGDNWGATSDSFEMGPFNKNRIVGKVDIVVPYKVNEFPYILKQMFKALFLKAD